MSILVTGGAGYVGSHVCKALKEEGYVPVVYDNLTEGHAWAVQFGPFIQGSLEDRKSLAKAFDQVRPEAVIHLASLIHIRASIQNPSLYWEKNLGGALCLLQMMVEKSVKRVIFSSTAAVFGSPSYTPIDEKHSKAPLNAYGKTKLAIEGMIEDFSQAHGLEFVILRYFNACGADPSGLIGEAHNPETHLIPLAIQTALGQRQLLQIFGDDYPTLDGTAIRDYVHVCDLADAHVLSLAHLLKRGRSIHLNLGVGQGYTVKQIVRKIEEHTGRQIPTQISPRLPQDSPELIADPRLAKQILNWQPKNSDLLSIISSAWNWEIKKPHFILDKIINSQKVFN